LASADLGLRSGIFFVFSVLGEALASAAGSVVFAEGAGSPVVLAAGVEVGLSPGVGVVVVPV